MKTKLLYIFLFISAFVLSNTNLYSQNGKTNAIPVSRITEVEKTVDGKKTTFTDSEEKYDAKGNVISEKEYKDGKIVKNMAYEYNSDNQRIKEIELDDSGKPKKIGEIKYENGLRKEKLIYNTDKKLISKKTYIYKY